MQRKTKNSRASDISPQADSPVSFSAALRLWLQIGLVSFGGPAGQIAVMHRVLVEDRKWISEERFLQGLNYCMLLPGPEAQQLAIYLGWLLHRTKGGLAAGILFILPGALLILALSFLYIYLGTSGFVQGLFFGIKACVLAIVLQAFSRIAGRILHRPGALVIAVSAFTGAFVFALSFPVIIIVAACAGMAVMPTLPAASGQNNQTVRPASGAGTASWQMAGYCLLLWLGPLIILYFLLGPQTIFVQQGMFFSKMAVVSFGGAYALLAYLTQEAVSHYSWLSASEMLDGLGLAETTPGPLILVVQFVGFLGAFRDPGSLAPWLAGMLGAGLTLWVTFVPCFMWIFVGGPFVERLQANRQLAAALSGITAALCGVIFNLALWFGLRVLFTELQPLELFGFTMEVPVITASDPAAMLIFVLTLLALTAGRMSIFLVLPLAALAGLIYHKLIIPL